MSSVGEIPKAAKNVGWAGLVIVILSILYQGFGLTFLNTPEKGGVVNTVGTYYRVTRVTDGDTLHVHVDGTDEKVRLIGIDAPETVDPRKEVQCFGGEASGMMEDLADDKLVRIEYDDSQGVRDTYGRLLAYVYLEDGQMLNRKMLAEGYAYEYTYMKPYKYQQEFRELQTLAKISGRGLWNPDTCNGSN